MNRILAVLAASLLASAGYAQTDSIKTNEPDTIRVGNFVIVKKNKDGRTSTSDSSIDNDDNHSFNIHFGSNRNRNRSSVGTNWLIFDLGFANWRDETNYGKPEANSYLHYPPGGPFTKEDLKLKTVKSTNANIWLFMQKLNVTKHVVNLKYGLGLEMYNFRYENDISYNKSPAYIYREPDSIDFSKNKLYVGYATIPFMINLNTSPNIRHGLTLGAGVSAGYLIGSHTKQVSDERGKVKTRSDFDLEKWRLAYVAELGLGPVHLYGSYSVNTLHQVGLKQYPYAVGVRFSNW